MAYVHDSDPKEHCSTQFGAVDENISEDMAIEYEPQPYSGHVDDQEKAACHARVSVDHPPSPAELDLETAGSRRLSAISRLPSTAASESGPPPDGGWNAWTACICAHFVFLSTWGFVNSFGVFQAYYADFLSPLTPSTISWIGSMQTFLSFFVSAFSGRISDAGHFRLCFWTGLVFQAVGIFGASFSTRYWQLMLSQGFCVGIAAGFLTCPTMSVMVTYFHRRRGLALGILSCGNVSGGLIFPAMARQLLPSIGFAWTLRTVGFLQMGLLIPCGLLIRTRLRPSRASEPIFNLKAFLEPEYSLYIGGMVFNMAGTFIIYYYISSFGRSGISPGMTYAQSLNLLMIMNGTGLIGRISAARLADYVGPLNIVYLLAFLGAVFSFTWIAVHDTVSVYIWVPIYGISGGAIQALFPTGLASLTPNVRQVGQRIGMGFSIIGISIISGPPAAGAMVTRMGGSFVGTQAFAGALHVVGAFFVMGAKVARIRRTGSRWSDKI